MTAAHKMRTIHAHGNCSQEGWQTDTYDFYRLKTPGVGGCMEPRAFNYDVRPATPRVTRLCHTLRAIRPASTVTRPLSLVLPRRRLARRSTTAVARRPTRASHATPTTTSAPIACPPRAPPETRATATQRTTPSTPRASPTERSPSTATCATGSPTTPSAATSRCLAATRSITARTIDAARSGVLHPYARPLALPTHTDAGCALAHHHVCALPAACPLR